MNLFYRLDEALTPVACSIEEWAAQDGRGHPLAATAVDERLSVVTVFRSVNPEPGAFFETQRVENGVYRTATWRGRDGRDPSPRPARCATWSEAVAMHTIVCGAAGVFLT